MNPLLKKAIVNFVIENDKEFQINNATTEKFRAYIYDASGSYLIGGKDVSNFINEFIKLFKK